MWRIKRKEKLQLKIYVKTIDINNTLYNNNSNNHNNNNNNIHIIQYIVVTLSFHEIKFLKCNLLLIVLQYIYII